MIGCAIRRETGRTKTEGTFTMSQKWPDHEVRPEWQWKEFLSDTKAVELSK